MHCSGNINITEYNLATVVLYLLLLLYYYHYTATTNNFKAAPSQFSDQNVYLNYVFYGESV